MGPGGLIRNSVTLSLIKIVPIGDLITLTQMGLFMLLILQTAIDFQSPNRSYFRLFKYVFLLISKEEELKNVPLIVLANKQVPFLL